MKKNAIIIALILLALLVMPGAGAVGVVGGIEANPLMCVGLTCDSKGKNIALNAVNLQNYENAGVAYGLGYRFGYMNAGVFVEVGRTSETKITMVKNRNVSINSAGTYIDGTDGAKLIGAYHDDTGLSFDDAQAAADKAAELRTTGISAFAHYTNGKWGVRAGSYSESGNGRKSGSAYCISITVTGTNNIIFQYDSGSTSNPLIIAPDITGYARPLTLFMGYRYVGYFQYNRMDGNNITVVNLVDMQDYAKGVIPYEMSASWPLEALKAQTLCAKSYIVFNGGRHKSAGFDVCNTTHCQVYHGANRANTNSDRAVDETYGMYVTYQGNICNTVYSSSCGGATEDSENVWGTYNAYLRGVEDNFEDLNRATNGIWQFTCTNDTLTQLLTSKGYTNSGVVDFYVSQYTRMGNVLEITLVDTTGKSYKFEKSAVRTFLDSTALGVVINSVRFTVTSGDMALTVISSGGQKTSFKTGEKVWIVGADGKPVEITLDENTRILSADGTTSGLPSSGTSSTGTYVVNGRGWGHNVGMSQYGALGMAERGYTFDQIIKYYFTGVEILVGDK